MKQSKYTEDELDLNSMNNGTERECTFFFSQKPNLISIFRKFYKVGYEKEVT